MSAATAIQGVPFFGRMFRLDLSSDLQDIIAWPSLMVMASFVWLVAAGLLGVAMPLVQLLELDARLFYTALTAHGAALAFPFTFQLMAGLSLHRAGGCLGKAAKGPLVSAAFWCMNIGATLLTLAIFFGLNISLVIMYPLPMVGAELGQWSIGVVRLGFIGIWLVLLSVIVFYPLQLYKMLFFEPRREELLLSERTLKDPGMLGMALAAFVLLATGIPLLIVYSAHLLGLLGIVGVDTVSWANEPVVFQFAFFIFAHNLMEAMALMVIAAVYATLPLYLADGSRALFSNTLARLALWILLLASLTSFFHHFITLFPNLPAVLAYHGHIMSWGTGIGAALSIFTILATIWQHGLKPAPGVLMILLGFALYILDGASAVVTSNVGWSFRLHGTMWQSGHTMTVLVAMSLMWMGVLYHHYPVLTGRRLSDALGNRFVVLASLGVVGAALVMLAGGADGMPRRFADWGQGGWMSYGVAILLFGLLIAAAYLVFAYDLLKSRDIGAAAEPGALEPAE